jgi:hypothetical protein
VFLPKVTNKDESSVAQDEAFRLLEKNGTTGSGV